MSLISKPLIYTIAYYFFAIVLTTYIEASGNFKSGPCTPNFDIMAPVLFFGVSCISLLVYTFKAIAHRGPYIMVAIIHAFVVMGAILVIIINSKRH